MLTLINESLKLSNLQAVFRAAADEGCETRAEIAASTGLSIVTAGKAVEEFLDTGIFIQKTNQKKSVGRQAGRIRTNPNYTIVVIDLRKSNFRVLFFDLSARCVDVNEHEYIADYSYPENLCTFLHRVKSQMLGCREKRYISMSVVVPGVYDGVGDIITGSGYADLEKIKLREFAKSKAGMPMDVVTDNMNAAVRYCAAVCRNDENILYINTSNGIDARFVARGKALRRNSACGPIPVGPQGLVANLFEIIRCMCNIAGINKVIIESDELNFIEDAEGELIRRFAECEKQMKNAPRLNINPDISYACVGAALTSRNIWFDKLMS